jgi:hypothetical protein
MNQQEREPLGEIEMGFSIEQATAIVKEFDALWQHSNIHGKKKVIQLWGLRKQLAEAVGITGASAVHVVLTGQAQVSVETIVSSESSEA